MSYSQFVNDLKELKIKKKGRRPKVSPYKFYPSAAELEAQEALLGELKDYSRRLEAAANGGSVDAVYGVPGATPESFATKAYDIAQKVSQFNMLAFADFSSLVVGERYFPSQDNKNQILQTWTDNFVNLCKSTNEEMRKKVAGVVSDGVLSGRNLREMIKEVQNTCGDFSRTKAELIATTEVGKLNSAIARNQSESAGIEYYEWSAAMDGRTRESHAVMDGKICKWGDDDHYWEWVDGKDGKRELKQRDRPSAAYKGAPGTDFRCRCVALPYVPEYEDDYVREEGPVRGVVQGPGEGAIELPLINERNKIQETLVKSFKVAKEKHPGAKYKRMDVDGSVWVDEKRLDKVFESIPQKRRDNDEVDKFNKEYEMAQILKRYGLGTILVEESGPKGQPTPDAIVNGIVSEFKQITGNYDRIKKNLRKAIQQNAKHVYMNIKSDLKFGRVMVEIKDAMKNHDDVTAFFYLGSKMYSYKNKK